MSAANHFGITEKDMSKIGVNAKTLMIEYLPLFDPARTRAPLVKINLMFYIDRKGDFTESILPSAKVAMAMFNKLNKTEKQEVIQYLQWGEENKEQS